jgi:hypothetical protein
MATVRFFKFRVGADKSDETERGMWNRGWRVRVESASTQSTVTNMAMTRSFVVMPANFNVDGTEVAAVCRQVGVTAARERTRLPAKHFMLGVCVERAH